MNTKNIDWESMALMPKFVELHRKKKGFMLTWWIIGSIFFYLLPVCAGYFPELMRVKLFGRLNFGFFFCLFEFAMVWAIAIHYTRTSEKVFDPLSKEVLAAIREEAK